MATWSRFSIAEVIAELALFVRSSQKLALNSVCVLFSKSLICSRTDAVCLSVSDLMLDPLIETNSEDWLKIQTDWCDFKSAYTKLEIIM